MNKQAERNSLRDKGKLSDVETLRKVKADSDLRDLGKNIRKLEGARHCELGFIKGDQKG